MSLYISPDWSKQSKALIVGFSFTRELLYFCPHLNMIKLLCVSVLRGGCFLTYWATEILDYLPFSLIPCFINSYPTPRFLILMIFAVPSAWVSAAYFFLSPRPGEYWLGSITCFDQRDVSGCGVNRSLKCTDVVWLAHIALVICHKKNMPPVAADSRRMWRHLEWTGTQCWTWS